MELCRLATAGLTGSTDQTLDTVMQRIPLYVNGLHDVCIGIWSLSPQRLENGYYGPLPICNGINEILSRLESTGKTIRHIQIIIMMIECAILENWACLHLIVKTHFNDPPQGTRKVKTSWGESRKVCFMRDHSGYKVGGGVHRYSSCWYVDTTIPRCYVF